MSRNKRIGLLPMKRKRLAAALMLLMVLPLSACGDSTQEQTLYPEELMVPEQANYETVSVEMGQYVKTGKGSVVVYYPVTAELSWEKSNASFREILVKKDQKVKKGEVLAIFDIDVSKADLEELSLKLTRTVEDMEAEKEERLSAIEDAKKAAEGLTGRSLRIAALKTEKLQTGYEQFIYQSEREIAQIKERMEKLEDEIENNTLTAPYDGVIDTVISYHPGDPVVANQVLITMHATDKYYFVADDYSGNLRYNMEVTVESGKKNDRKSHAGRVVAASNVLPASVSQGKAMIELYEDILPEELDGTLTYQCNAEKLQDVLLADKGAVNREDEKYYVYVLWEDMVQKRYIVQGAANTEAVWVLDGLSEGQSLITD